MNKYLIKFSKIGNMKYISHLDLMNVFQRVFRRAGIQLVYSQGFSPHPKISIAHPLSLGIESIGEYMEIELVNHWDAQELLLALNKQLPKGIGILACKEIVKKIKSLAAEVRYAEYNLTFLKEGLNSNQIKNAIQTYLDMEEIIVIKKQVKKKKEKEIDIKPLILTFKLEEETEVDFKIFTILKTGSNGNLNPELLMKSFIDKMELDIDKDTLHILRKDMYLTTKQDMLTTLYDI